MQMNDEVKRFLKWKKRELHMSIGKRIVGYCVGLTFIAGISALIVYAGHGWTWPPEINGVTLNVPEFVIVIVLVTLPVAICSDLWRNRNPRSEES
jgi:hypothetical protein